MELETLSNEPVIMLQPKKWVLICRDEKDVIAFGATAEMKVSK